MEIKDFQKKYDEAKDVYDDKKALELLEDRYGSGKVKTYFNKQGFYHKYQIIHQISKAMADITSFDYVSDSEFQSYYDWLERFYHSFHTYYSKVSEENYYPISWKAFDRAVNHFKEEKEK